MAPPVPHLPDLSEKVCATGAQMKRDTVINVLLIIAGIVLAIALFGAGAFWRGKVAPKRSSELHIRSSRQHPAERGIAAY
jgi:hypothetical protein